MVTHTDHRVFVLSMIPLMIFFGMRHRLDVDHITAIDNLVRMHNVRKRSIWVGTGFSLGDSTSVFLGDAAGGKLDTPSFWGGLFGVIALVVIDGINIFSMKKFGKTGTAILGVKIVTRTHFLGSR